MEEDLATISTLLTPEAKDRMVNSRKFYLLRQQICELMNVDQTFAHEDRYGSFLQEIIFSLRKPQRNVVTLNRETLLDVMSQGFTFLSKEELLKLRKELRKQKRKQVSEEIPSKHIKVELI